LFGKQPQRFLISSEVKCAHFHGTTVRKPIPFYQVYKGNLFELVDQAVNFVLSKIDLAVGTRAQGPEAPVAYEIPPEVIAEAIVKEIVA
jgi:ATP-dependent DNA helicase RecG